MAGRIEDYTIVGDMHSVALVSADGSVDWRCLPRFDSEACFAAVAFDRAATYADDVGETALAVKWRGIRDEINKEVCEKGYDSGRGAFLQYHGAAELFDRLLALRNDVGLLSEEYDPRYGRLVGNMPQAFSHVPLVQTALNLEGHAEEHRRGPWDERRSVPG